MKNSPASRNVLQYDSMRVPYSWVRRGVRWTGEYVLLIPLNRTGGLAPYMEKIAGFRNPRGRAVYISDQPKPHQGNKERIRRLAQRAKYFYGTT